MNPYDTREKPEAPTPHRFYKHRSGPQGKCLTCGKPVIRDRFASPGWTHYETASIFCEAPRQIRVANTHV